MLFLNIISKIGLIENYNLKKKTIKTSAHFRLVITLRKINVCLTKNYAILKGAELTVRRLANIKFNIPECFRKVNGYSNVIKICK